MDKKTLHKKMVLLIISSNILGFSYIIDISWYLGYSLWRWYAVPWSHLDSRFSYRVLVY